MKTKISVSIDEKMLKKIEEVVGKGRFRNKSHIIEYSVRKLIEEEGDGIK
jgi:Arc/MetJ-type ribon-helix-helix transcriptional regulator